MSELGAQFRFKVTIDGIDIGSFTALDGLSAEYSVMPYSEGGENGYEHHLPGPLRYSTIKLSRALYPGSPLASWFSKFTQRKSRASSVKTAAITALDSSGKVVASWDLYDVYPLKWTGPSFAANGNAVLTETLELRHHGFKKP